MRWFVDIGVVGQALGELWDIRSAEHNDEFARRVNSGLRRRVLQFCAHIDPHAPRPVLASLSHGKATCRPCASTLLRQPVHDDGVCDLCDLPADSFYDVMTVADTVLGPVLVHANACVECRLLCEPITAERAA